MKSWTKAGVVGALLMLGLAVGVALGQQPASPGAPQENAAQQQITKDAQAAIAQQQLLLEKLHGITEFQQYLQVTQQLDSLRQRYMAASAPAPAPVAVPGVQGSKTPPATPETPKPAATQPAPVQQAGKK